MLSLPKPRSAYSSRKWRLFESVSGLASGPRCTSCIQNNHVPAALAPAPEQKVVEKPPSASLFDKRPRLLSFGMEVPVLFSNVNAACKNRLLPTRGLIEGRLRHLCEEGYVSFTADDIVQYCLLEGVDDDKETPAPVAHVDDATTAATAS